MIGEVLSNRLAKDTSATSFYPTPVDVTMALLRFLCLPKQTVIWEPACGDGKIVEVFQQAEHKVVASDLHEYGKYPAGVDFLQQIEHPADWIITNPPFHLADEFIAHCCTFPKPFALLLKSQFWHAKRRCKLFYLRRPEYVLPLTWRPDFLFGAKSGSPTMECLWTVWGKAASPITQYQILQRPNNEKEATS